jgi:N-acyl-D-aspartate/D-glutamate deacylase
VLIGNCGFGFAPVHADARERAMLTMTRNEAVPLASMQQGMPWDWETFPEFLDSVDRTPKSVNVLAYQPITPLMVWVMGLERAKAGELPTDAEHAEMCRLLNEAMDAGARGWSTQRMGNRSVQRDYDGTPMPSDLMHDETALALAQVLADRNDGFIQYTYVDFGSIFDGNFNVMVDQVRPHLEKVAEVSGRPVLVGGAGEADFDWLQSCHERGLRIYGQGATVTIVNMPQITNLAEAPNIFDLSLAWCDATVGTVDEKKAKFADPAVREKMRAELPLLQGAYGPMDNWVVIRTHKPEFQKYDELPLGKVAADLGKDAFDAFCDLNIADDMLTKWLVEFQLAGGTNEQNILTHEGWSKDPYMIPGISDGGAHTKYASAGHYATRYLMTYVREYGWHSLEEAHWRLSALPAYCAGFADRGTLVEGAPADIVVYDLDALDITERETAYDYPGNEWRVVDHAKGYQNTLVNGEVTMEGDAQTNVPSGRLLRHGKADLPAYA